MVDWFDRFGIQVNDFQTDFVDGLLIAKTIDKIKPGVINWQMFAKPKGERPLNIFQKRTNCTVLVESVRAMGLSNTGIGASDFTDGNTKMIMGFIRTLMIWEAGLNKSLL